MNLDYFALIIMIVVSLILVYAAIYIHDIPYEMAKKRNHPHQDAIHVGGWLSLFTLHAIWPFLWIWATLYKPGIGYGFKPDGTVTTAGDDELSELKQIIDALQERVASIENQLAEDLQND
jgi:hypothetical protein